MEYSVKYPPLGKVMIFNLRLSGTLALSRHTYLEYEGTKHALDSLE